jgi:protein-S-isoprenylcysteine O-methyltransferase Ste14
MGRVFGLIYGVAAYLLFLVVFLYAVGFVANWMVPKSIDSGVQEDLIVSILNNAVLLGIFAVQHSVMARPGFKAWWTRIVPQSIERSTYVVFSGLVLILLFWKWRPLPGVVWDVEGSAGAMVLWGLCALGWLIALASTFAISHFDLFGLRQVYLNLRNERYSHLNFRVLGLYRLVRHPLMLGFLIAFWATPRMTIGHLLFAAATTVYILIALQLEERDLIAHYGEQYREYRKQVPMLLPLPRRTGVDSGIGTAE